MANLIARSGWQYCLRGGLAVLCFWGAAAFAQVRANVEFSNESQTDPHPTTYSWSEKKTTVKDPTSYYTWFYTGTVGLDARVDKGVVIERVPVKWDDYEANRKWMVTKIKYYYQLTKNQPVTALSELTGEAPPASAQTGVAGLIPNLNLPQIPSIPGSAPAGAPTGVALTQPTPPPAGPTKVGGDVVFNGSTQGGYYGQANLPTANLPSAAGLTNGLDAAGNAINNANFDAQAGAEWTFFYDQLVLWQYYCARQILGKEAELLEGGAGNGQPGQPGQMDGQPGLALGTMNGPMTPAGGGGRRGRRGAQATAAMAGMPGMPGATPAPTNPNQQADSSGLSLVELASAVEPGDAGKQTLEAIKKRNSLQIPATLGQQQPQPQPIAGQPGAPVDPNAPAGTLAPGAADTAALQAAAAATPTPLPGAPSPFGNFPMPNQNQKSSIRELFNPAADYLNPDRILAYRNRYEAAAQQREQEIYKSFVSMLTDIEQRELNQEQYEQWLESKRKDLTNYANDWRRAQDGQVFSANGTTFVVTKDPNEALPTNAIKIDQAERVTPQDIIGDDGQVKQPSYK